MKTMMMMLVVIMEAQAKSLTDTIIVKDRALQLEAINLTVSINNMCECKMVCFTNTKCHFATAIVSAEERVCHMSYHEDVYHELGNATGQITFYWATYIKEGRRYYLMYTRGIGWDFATDRCVAEGGQLAVAEDEAKMKELQAVLARHGETPAWIGLKFMSASNGSMTGPFWHYRTGFKLKSTHSSISNEGVCFDLSNTNQMWTTKNLNCETLLSYICQRDF
ncbi:uncharacterized protein LOC121878309 isoform X1 [Homarus americanus]|uniref:Putative Lectin C-type domain-containing protein 5 n=1 Tax=Homarus americanus TaxID=6706 RepID=A0A8J5JP84_HOMAM|nr:uncharacterized protein LOC121878309 isoform X1 [Homarus americanus]KAG7158624.1 putative Lectin C-type domain-containing protein 5 [Homarus americanus]